MPVKPSFWREHSYEKRVLVSLKPGVKVRQSPEGENFCKIQRCKEHPASEEPTHRGLCTHHWQTRADGRPKCRQCGNNFAVDPIADQLCGDCHPAYKETTPFEAHALSLIREGLGPVDAVRKAMGEGTTAVQATRELEKMSASAVKFKRLKKALAKAGITDERIFAKLSKNMDATKRVYNGDGEVIDEVPDVRASNQTIDMLFKLKGAYPSRFAKAEPPQQTNIAVAMLPAVEPRRPDAQIYTLPQEKKRLGGGGEE
jgi:hypothetical protein